MIQKFYIIASVPKTQNVNSKEYLKNYIYYNAVYNSQEIDKTQLLITDEKIKEV